jgi:16S rRNA (guanine527-N7)-methyltransferase
MKVPALTEQLANGLEALQLPADPGRIDALLKFLALMHKWGATYNLTAIKDARAAVGLHLLDSLAVSPYLQGEHILDVGTGAGLPGIPLAILNEQRRFVLLDSSAKKIRFVRQALVELGLRNVETAAVRVEEYQDLAGFDTVLARAFASLSEILQKTRRLLAPGGRILALKGRVPEEEIQGLVSADIKVHGLTIPGLDIERHVIELRAD